MIVRWDKKQKTKLKNKRQSATIVPQLSTNFFLRQSRRNEGLRFDSSWGLRIFSLSHARDKSSLPSSKATNFLIPFTKQKQFL